MKRASLLLVISCLAAATALAKEHTKPKTGETADVSSSPSTPSGDRDRDEGTEEMGTEEQAAAAKREMEALMADEIERRVEAAGKAPEKRVFGKVLAIEKEDLILDIGGAALPVRVDRATRIEGSATPAGERISARLQDAFPAGQLVSVTYDLKQTHNVALAIDELKHSESTVTQPEAEAMDDTAPSISTPRAQEEESSPSAAEPQR